MNFNLKIYISCSNSCNLFIKLDEPLFKQMFDSYLEFQSHFFEYEPQFYHFNIDEDHVLGSEDISNDHLREAISLILPEESQLIVEADDCPKIYGLFENNNDIIFVVSSSIDHGVADSQVSSVTTPKRTVRVINANDNMKKIYEEFKISPFGFELALDFENELIPDFVSFLAYSPDSEDHSHHFLQNWVTARYNVDRETVDQLQLKEMTIKLAKIFEALDSIGSNSGPSILAQTPSLNIRSNFNHKSRDLINAWKNWMDVEPHESLLSNKNFKRDSIALTVSALESIFERSYISIQEHCRKTDMVKYNCDSFNSDCTNELISLGKENLYFTRAISFAYGSKIIRFRKFRLS